jgi:hypothetical protein|tara:strand:+ start:4583 stop:4777 length:195 start_codon:yes stop_codon:yes gene_type:complete
MTKLAFDMDTDFAEKVVVADLLEHYKIHTEQVINSDNLHEEDRLYSKKLIKALKRVLSYYGEKV